MESSAPYLNVLLILEFEPKLPNWSSSFSIAGPSAVTFIGGALLELLCFCGSRMVNLVLREVRQTLRCLSQWFRRHVRTMLIFTPGVTTG